MKLRLSGVLMSMVLLIMASNVVGATQTYSVANPAGSVAFTDIVENADSVPQYGAPIRVGNMLIFNSSSFSSTSNDGVADNTAGILTMQIDAPAGKRIEKVLIGENGNYSFGGSGTVVTSAGVTADLTLTDNDGGLPGPLTDGFSYTYYLGGGGTSWSGLMEIDFTAFSADVVSVSLQLDNILSTTSEIGTASTISKQVVTAAATVEVVIPEPATLGLLALGLLGLVRKRR